MNRAVRERSRAGPAKSPALRRAKQKTCHVPAQDSHEKRFVADIVLERFGWSGNSTLAAHFWLPLLALNSLSRRSHRFITLTGQAPEALHFSLAALASVEQITAIWKAGRRAAYDCATNPSTGKGTICAPWRNHGKYPGILPGGLRLVSGFAFHVAILQRRSNQNCLPRISAHSSGGWVRCSVTAGLRVEHNLEPYSARHYKQGT